MQEKQTARVFVEIFLIIITLGLLSAVAVPRVSDMGGRGGGVGMEAEFRKVNTAVAEMLRASPSGAIEPVGPTADMGRVHTCDEPPLCLANYLVSADKGSAGLTYLYSFAADGTVNQIVR